jgi:hypothetical protein
MQTNYTQDLFARLHDAENKLFNAEQSHREYKHNAGSRHAIVCGSAMGMLRGILWFAKEQDNFETQGIRKVLSFLEFCSELPVEMFKTFDDWTDVRAHFDDLYAMYLDDATESSFKVWLDAVNVSKSIHGKG